MHDIGRKEERERSSWEGKGREGWILLVLVSLYVGTIPMTWHI
jgi:hypothetical protein